MTERISGDNTREIEPHNDPDHKAESIFYDIFGKPDEGTESETGATELPVPTEVIDVNSQSDRFDRSEQTYPSIKKFLKTSKFRDTTK